MDEGGGEDICDCDSESHSIPWSRGGTGRSAATTRAKPDGRGTWRRKSRVGGCREMTSTGRLGCEPLSVWKHGVREKGALGEKEVERQLHVPCDEPRFEEPELKSEPTDERDKLLTTLAPVRSARAGGLW